MKKDKWYGREQFVKNHNSGKIADLLSASVKSAGASIDELAEAFNKLAKI